MLGKIQGYFGIGENENISLLDAKEHTKIAVATILLSAALADENFGETEHSLLLKQLEHRFGISAADAEELLTHVQSPGSQELLVKYLQTLGNDLTIQQREHILTLAWGIIAADKVVTDEETRFAVKLRQLLGLSMEQSMRARKAAEGLTLDGFKEVVETSEEVHQGIMAQLARFAKRG